ncbi:MAG: AhpC/TSA family protein [Prevotella sp.]|nr:AhpC/TSA family protein [Prevotella sp.]
MKKNIILALVATLATITATAQDTPYSISGTASFPVTKVYLYDATDMRTPIDSTMLSEGRFSFSGTKPVNTLMAVLGDGDSFALQFFNDGTPLNISIYNHTVTASPLNEKLNGYEREMATINGEMAGIVYKVNIQRSTLTQQQMDSLVERYTQLEQMNIERVMQIVAENTDNLIPAAFISDLAYDLSYEQLVQVCQPSAPYYDHPAMQLPRRILESLQKRAPGKLFTDMTINDISGQPRSLSEWIGKGQYVMIDFWASWCGPCRQEMPNVVTNYEKYHSAGFEIIGISFDQRDAAWKNAVNQMHMAWPQLSDLGGWQSAAADVYGINSIPASILFDKEGRIIAINLRGEQLGQKLQELYGF